MQAINTKAVAMIAVTATAWLSFFGVGFTGVSFMGNSLELVNGYKNIRSTPVPVAHGLEDCK
jgi:hypothetical protein